MIHILLLELLPLNLKVDFLLMTFSSHGNMVNSLGLEVIHIEKQMMRFDISQGKEV